MAETMDRRTFMGAAGTALALGAGGSTAEPVSATTAPLAATGIRALVDRTPLIDTHEHLLAEPDRIAHVDGGDGRTGSDFGILMSHYTDSDLQVSGLSADDYRKLTTHGLTPREKWNLVAGAYERCRHTGYQICVRETVRALFGEDDIRESNCEKISRRLREGVKPGFYRHILRDVANIEHAQVNCLQNPILRQSEPATDLLSFDLTTVNLATNVQISALRQAAGGAEVATLQQAHAAIDRAFSTLGPRAIAVKDQCAYWRPLDFVDVSDAEAAPIFARFARDERSVRSAERKALQDNLFRRCLRRATEQKLPIKLHTGYYAGMGGMDLSVVRNNMAEAARLAREFPGTTFVLMHMAYPYQHELTALCKHYRNIYADMCWAWIIDPASATRFLKEFLMAAPACKLLTFGGDFMPVELVVGHARVARKGIALALTQLVQEGWLAESDVPALVERIMRGNAREIFDLKRVLANQP